MKRTIKAIIAAGLALTALISTGCSKRDGNQLIMATNAEFPPFEYVNSDKNFEGIDIEIAQAIAAKLGKKLKIESIPFENILDDVQAGKYDFGMAALTVKPDRMEKVAFSNTYATGVQVVIVKEGSGYGGFEEFYNSFDEDGTPTEVKRGIKIGVQKGTTGDSYASSDPEDWGFGSSSVVQYETGRDAVKALNDGKITAVIIDNEPAKAFVEENEGLCILEGAYTNEDYAVCVSRENSELLGQINQAIAQLQEDGTIDRILDKYIN